MQIRDDKLYRKEYMTFEHYCNEKARIVQSGGGCYLRIPPVDSHVLQTMSLPKSKTGNSSLKESLSTLLLSFNITRNGGRITFR